MPFVTEKELADAMVGIAKTQAAIINALRQPNDIRVLSNVQSSVGALAGHGRQIKQPVTLDNLPAHLLLKALSTPGANAQTLEQLAHQELSRLIGTNGKQGHRSD